MAARYSTVNLNTTLTNFGLDVFKQFPGICEEVAPVVRVGLTDTKYYIFNNAREMINNDIETRVAPKDEVNEIERSYTSSTLALEQHGLKELVSDEEMANADRSVIDPEADATSLIIQKLKLGREVALNTLLFDSSTTFSSYTAAATAYWDAATTYIEADVDAAKKSVEQNAGVEANTIVIPPDIARIIKKEDEIRDLIKYTDKTLLVNGDLPPVLWNLKVIIPKTMFNEGHPGVSTQTRDYLHDDKSVWVGYVNRATPSKKSLSCFYTFCRPINGVVDVGVKKYRWEPRNGNYIEGRWEYDIVCVAAGAGYVITGVDA